MVSIKSLVSDIDGVDVGCEEGETVGVYDGLCVGLCVRTKPSGKGDDVVGDRVGCPVG